MRKLLDASNMTRGICEGTAFNLSNLAASFRDTGNTHVANKLDLMVTDLQHAAEIIDKAVDDAIYESVRESEQSFFNTVNAALASIKIGAEQ